MRQVAKQKKPGILVLFSLRADVSKLNERLRQYVGGISSPIKTDRLLRLPLGGFVPCQQGLELRCYQSFEEITPGCLVFPAFPFPVDYTWIVWIKDLKGKFLFRNDDYQPSGVPKRKERKKP